MVAESVAPARDQDWSAFAAILAELLKTSPGALGAALIDGAGECVDYAGRLEPFDIKVAGAQMQLQVRLAAEHLSASGRMRQMIVGAAKRSYLLRSVNEDYVLVLVLARDAAYLVSERALSQAEMALRAEAGWELAPQMDQWVRVRVDPSLCDRHRPYRILIGQNWCDLEVIGTVVGLRRGEHGYRIRAGSREMTLVRERWGQWYADLRAADRTQQVAGGESP